MLQTFGVAAPEKAFPKLQDAMQVPTLNIRGLASSFVGPGARTIVPDRATAAIDIRLVKETPGEDLVTKLRAHIVKQGYHLVERGSRRCDAREVREARALDAGRSDARGVPDARRRILTPARSWRR